MRVNPMRQIEEGAPASKCLFVPNGRPNDTNCDNNNNNNGPNGRQFKFTGNKWQIFV